MIRTPISLSKIWCKFFCVLPISLRLFSIHSSFLIAFYSKVDLILSQLSSETSTHKPSLSSLFLLLPSTSFSLQIKTSSFFFLGVKRALFESYFWRAQWHPNFFLPSPLIFIKDFTILFSLLWHNSLRSEFSQTLLLILLSLKLPIINRLVKFSYSQLNSRDSDSHSKVITALNMLFPIFCTLSSSYFS